MRRDHRVVVDIYDPRGRVGSVRYVMHVAACRQAGADVEELPDTGLTRQETHRAAEELSVIPCRYRRIRYCRQQFCCSLPVGGVIIFPAQEAIIDPGHIRNACIKRLLVRRLWTVRSHDGDTPPFSQRRAWL